MVRPVYEVIRRTKNKRNKKDKANELKQNESWALKDILRGSYDSTVKLAFLKAIRLLLPIKNTMLHQTF